MQINCQQKIIASDVPIIPSVQIWKIGGGGGLGIKVARKMLLYNAEFHTTTGVRFEPLLSFIFPNREFLRM